MSTNWMSLEDVIKEYGLFHMYFEIGTMLGVVRYAGVYNETV
jgi:hypothetical protein